VYPRDSNLFLFGVFAPNSCNYSEIKKLRVYRVRSESSKKQRVRASSAGRALCVDGKSRELCGKDY
jgi:hypothetical protein